MQPIVTAEVGAFVDGVPRHAIRLLAGLDPAGLARALASGPPPTRPVLPLDLAGRDSAEAVVRAACDVLDQAVSALWPRLWADEDFSDARDDALTRAHLPLRMARLAARRPGVSQSWAVAAVTRRLQARGLPRRDVRPARDWEQLVLASSPGGLVLATPVPPEDPGFVLAALAWLADHAAVSVLLLATEPPDPAGPLGRFLFGARSLARSGQEPEASRVAGPEASRVAGPEASRVAGPEASAEPANDGRPHPHSAVEARLHRLIRADAELAPLFAFNRTIPEVARIACRVDLLWAAGRVVVEIDGPEHRSPARYRADRNRDHELMCAGYRVLRLTNADVIEDAGLALAKIRDLVRLSGNDRPWTTG